MKQSINLFAAELQAKAAALNPQQLVLIVVVAVAMLLSVVSFYGWQILNLKKQISLTVKQQQMLLGELETASKALTMQTADPGLMTELETLEQRRTWRQQLLISMDKLDIHNTTGFSPYLISLAKQIPDAVWLVNFRLEKGGEIISLAGNTSVAEAVPWYLSQLQTEASFTGKVFKNFNLTQYEDHPTYMSFSLIGLGAETVTEATVEAATPAAASFAGTLIENLNPAQIAEQAANMSFSLTEAGAQR